MVLTISIIIYIFIHSGCLGSATPYSFMTFFFAFLLCFGHYPHLNFCHFFLKCENFGIFRLHNFIFIYMSYIVGAL